MLGWNFLAKNRHRGHIRTAPLHTFPVFTYDLPIHPVCTQNVPPLCISRVFIHLCPYIMYNSLILLHITIGAPAMFSLFAYSLYCIFSHFIVMFMHKIL